MDMGIVLAAIGVLVTIVIGGWQIYLVAKPPRHKKTESGDMEVPASNNLQLISGDCGDMGINLESQRLLLSRAFGSYFSGLLEQDLGYVHLKGQIECSLNPDLEPLQQIYWALNDPKGPRIIIIAADGGMGKSTLAAKIVKCLFQTGSADIILGDSAKTHKVGLRSGTVEAIDPAFSDLRTFHSRLYAQLGIPKATDTTKPVHDLQMIRDRITGRRAVIVVDNLDAIDRGAALLESLRSLVSRDVRVVVTTRSIADLSGHERGILLVSLRPVMAIASVRAFTNWHISSHAAEHPELRNLLTDIDNDNKLNQLIAKTGGSPLLIQLLLSDIARSSWKYLETLPRIFGAELIQYLYRERWMELGNIGSDGALARDILKWISSQQYAGEPVTEKSLMNYCMQSHKEASSVRALRLLLERFLLVNSDAKAGNYSLFPTLMEYLKGDLP